MHLFECEVSLPSLKRGDSPLSHIEQALQFRVPKGTVPIRMAVTESSAEGHRCEVGVIEGLPESGSYSPEPIFQFRRRSCERTERFNAVLVVPTGVGAEIGGHAGDATPVARLLGGACDLLITHPNVVNASDINEIPENSVYVEGSILSRLMMGTIGLQPVRSNRVLVVIDDHSDELFANAAINAVSAARASFGLDCPKVVKLNPPVRLTSEYTASGRATGKVEGLEFLLDVLREEREAYDAVAISSVIAVPHSYHQEYFDRQGEMVNPWGGVEAMLTHAISSILDVPSAHSPMFESREIANVDPGIVEPRMAAEAVSLAFLQCILKGLQRSPRIVTDESEMAQPGILTAEDLSCLVIPDGCVGIPTLAALEQGIPVIAVKGNRNLMRNDLRMLPWAEGQLHFAENYLEAHGIMGALKAGLSVGSLVRPMKATKVVRRQQSDSAVAGKPDKSGTSQS